MKKIIAVLTMVLAFTISANAQDKKVSSQDAAQKDITALAAKVTLSEDLKRDLTTLMVMKHDAKADNKLTPEQKANALKQYEKKLLSALSKEQKETLMKNPELLKKLTK